jgi:hypothetical protein
MPGLDYIKGYDEGGSTEPPTETPITAVGKAVQSKSKYALPTPTGSTGVDEGILERMQKLIDEREAQKGGFMESLRDAQAWWTGGVAGPSESLARRAKEREEFDATTFGMRRDLAQYKVGQEQARNLDKQLFGVLAPAAAGVTQPGAAGVTQPGATQPQAGGVVAPAQTGGLLGLIRDPGLRQSIAVQAQSGDRQGAMKSIQSYLAKNAEDPVMVKELRFMIENKLIDPNLVPAAVLTKFAGSGAFVPHDVRGPGGTMQTTPIGAAGAVSPPASTLPGVRTAAPAAAAPAPAAPAPAAVVPAPAAAPAAAPSPATGPQPIPQVQPLPKVGAPAAAKPAAPIGPGGLQVGSKEELEVRKEAIGTELQETAKDIAKDRAATVEAGSNASDRLASVQYINNLVTTNPRAFGVLQKPGVLTAVLGAVEEGANIGNLGAVGITGISTAVRKAMPGATQADIDAAQKATREFALMQLNAAKIYLKGQGAVSDAERQLIRELAGSVKNSPEAIRDFLKWNEIRANFDKQNGAAYKEFNKRNPNVSFERYKETPEYEKLKSEYEANIKNFVTSSTTPKADIKSHPGAALLDKYPKR